MQELRRENHFLYSRCFQLFECWNPCPKGSKQSVNGHWNQRAIGLSRHQLRLAGGEHQTIQGTQVRLHLFH